MNLEVGLCQGESMKNMSTSKKLPKWTKTAEEGSKSEQLISSIKISAKLDVSHFTVNPNIKKITKSRLETRKDEE